MGNDELVTSYAALALYDGDAEISADQISTLITATGNTVEAYWPLLFADKLFSNNGIEALIMSGGAVAGGGSASAAAGGEAAKEEEAPKKEEKKEEVADIDGAMDMFGGGDY